MDRISPYTMNVFKFLEEASGEAKEHVEETMVFKGMIKRDGIDPLNLVGLRKESRTPGNLDVANFLARNGMGSTEGNLMKLSMPTVREYRPSNSIPAMWL